MVTTSEMNELIASYPRALKNQDLFPIPIIVDGPTTEPEVNINGRMVIQFATGNYLGVATHPAVKQALIHGVEIYGATSSGSRLVCGSQSPQLELEHTIAEFEGTEEAVLYFLVTVANSGSMVSLMNPPVTQLLHYLGLEKPSGKREIFFDWLSHPSIIDACALAVGNGNMVPYRHSDMVHLESKLTKSDADIKMIATDGLFSTDGDLARLPEIVKLADQYNAMVFVDDAHGTGVLGQNGRGIWEHYGLSDRVDIKVGSLAKAFAGGLGGFIAGNKDFTDYLRVTGGHYIFGGSIPPAVAMAITASIKVSMAEPWRRQTVLSNADYLRDKLHALGFDTVGSASQIVPIIIGKDEDAIAISAQLLEAGFFVPSFRYPAVPRGKARIRATMMATHTREHIDNFVDALKKINGKLVRSRPS